MSEVVPPNIQVAQSVARLRALLMAADKEFGGFQWSNNSLYSACIEYQRVIAECSAIQEPSPFKRAAAMAIAFMSKCNIYGTLNNHKLLAEVGHIERAPAAFLIFEYVRASLYKAAIVKPEGEFNLDNLIKVSEHTMKDIVHALSHASRNGLSSFHLLALLFEQLAYLDNPKASYPRTF